MLTTIGATAPSLLLGFFCWSSRPRLAATTPPPDRPRLLLSPPMVLVVLELPPVKSIAGIGLELLLLARRKHRTQDHSAIVQPPFLWGRSEVSYMDKLRKNTCCRLFTTPPKAPVPHRKNATRPSHCLFPAAKTMPTTTTTTTPVSPPRPEYCLSRQQLPTKQEAWGQNSTRQAIKASERTGRGPKEQAVDVLALFSARSSSAFTPQSGVMLLLSRCED